MTTVEKAVVVTRPTRLQESVKRYNTKAQAKFYVEKRGQSFQDYELEEDIYEHSRDHVLKAIPRDLKIQIVDRNLLPNYLFSPKDLIICLGQDGLVVNTAKYLEGQPVIAINPDPDRFDGVLLPFLPDQTEAAVQAVMNGKFQARNLTMARVDMNDGQKLYAFNDLFIGPRSHITARYTIHDGERSERQMSSGILVATPAGSTGWISSLFNQTRGIARFQGDGSPLAGMRLEWEDQKLVYMVREPFASKWSKTEMVAGVIEGTNSISVESHMSESGVIFSDGMESDFIQFNTGSVARIGIAEKSTTLVVKF